MLCYGLFDRNTRYGDAANIIARGDADVMVAGGAESAVNAIALAGFARMKAVTSDFNDAPEKASRPWDKSRSGFVMGEGSGALFWKNWNMPRPAVPRFMPKLSATA